MAWILDKGSEEVDEVIGHLAVTTTDLQVVIDEYSMGGMTKGQMAWFTNKLKENVEAKEGECLDIIKEWLEDKLQEVLDGAI